MFASHCATKSGGRDWKQNATPQIHRRSHLVECRKICAWLISNALSHSSADTKAEENKERSGRSEYVRHVSCIYCAASTEAVLFIECIAFICFSQ